MIKLSLSSGYTATCGIETCTWNVTGETLEYVAEALRLHEGDHCSDCGTLTLGRPCPACESTNAWRSDPSAEWRHKR